MWCWGATRRRWPRRGPTSGPTSGSANAGARCFCRRTPPPVWARYCAVNTRITATPLNGPPAARRLPLLPAKTRVAVPVLVLLVVLDQITKAQAQLRLQPEHYPYPVVGDFIRFTLTH